ncbi:tetratricopeptide repeat protein [Paucidesulfovibrio longus]|uniref:tetratricopeptide repeat protein n=1 Tax=Paucidesulfovibrio longus TaxID=889 RepID=UPI0003B7A374|nr:tetratricopeptide repeat protein [Paucidesulfovibrio longus]
MKQSIWRVIFACVLLALLGAVDAFAFGPGDEFFLAGVELDARGRPAEAVEAYTEAIKRCPADYEAFLNRGAAYVLLEQYELAIGDFTEVIRLHPADTDAWYNRGACWTEMGRYAEAVKDYDEALRLDPMDADAYYNRGYALLRLGRREEGVHDFRSVVRLEPTAGDAREQLGLAFWEQGDLDRACPELQEACDLGACEGLELAREKRHCR